MRILQEIWLFVARCRVVLPVVILMTGLWGGCEKSPFLRSGPEITRKVVLPPFGEIYAGNIFEIELSNDTLFSLELTGAENMLENIGYSVTDGRLELVDNNSLRWLPDYPRVKLTISFPGISEITLSLAEPSYVFSKDTLVVSSLALLSEGLLAEIDLTVNASYLFLRTRYDDFGHYTFSGKAENAEFRFFGSAKVDASKLVAKNASVRNVSIGDCYVNVTNLLRVWLIHYGNVYYSGSPEVVIIESMGSKGRLIPTDPG